MRTDSKKARDLHETALRNFDRIQSALYEERNQSLEDRRFYSIAGAQWEGSLSDQFENKPKFEVNKVHLSVIKIFNEYRNNRISVNFITKDGAEDDGLADVCDGLFRADEQDSGAEEAYDNGFEEAVGGGFGALRLTTEYENEEDDEDERQRIRIEPIYDADASVFFDLDAKRQDKADAKYCFVMYSTTPEDYEEEWGEPVPSSMPKQISDVEYDWFTPDVVYFAEYYKVEEKKETVYVYKTLAGIEQKYTEEDFEEDESLEKYLNDIGAQRVREKQVKRKKVHKYIISGDKVLEDQGYIAGKHIPIVPIYGKRWFVDNVERCMGHVRLVKDAQRLKNMLTSKLAEISSLSTVQKPMLTPEQVAGHEMHWAEDNIKNYPYLLINPVTDAAGNPQPAGPVAYTQPPQIPPALGALMQSVDMDTQELLGNSAEADKMISHVSGKAHELVQKRIDGQAFIYMSNFAKAIKRVGEVWLSMARDVYVEKGRKMKSVSSMDKVGSVELGKPGMTSDGDVIKNDLTKATFDVLVDVGPSSMSQREATAETLINMLSTTQDPQTRQVLEAMVMLNMEGDGIAETRGYFRKQLVQMGVLEPTPEEAEAMAQPQEPSAQDKALEAMAAESMAKAQEAQAEAEKTRSEIIEILSKVDLNKAKTAETYSDVDRRNLMEVQQMLQKQEEQAQRAKEKQAQLQLQQQKMLQQASSQPRMAQPGGGQM
jgi:hypothetical protein